MLFEATTLHFSLKAGLEWPFNLLSDLPCNSYAIEQNDLLLCRGIALNKFSSKGIGSFDFDFFRFNLLIKEFKSFGFDASIFFPSCHILSTTSTEQPYFNAISGHTLL